MAATSRSMSRDIVELANYPRRPAHETGSRVNNREDARVGNKTSKRGSTFNWPTCRIPYPRITHPHIRQFLAILAVNQAYIAQEIVHYGGDLQGRSIGNYFGDTSKLHWLQICAALSSLILCPIVSQLADYWGRKWLVVTFGFCGGLGCFLTASANSMTMAVTGQTLCSFSFGGRALLHVIPSEVLPRRWRGLAQATLILSQSTGITTAYYMSGTWNPLDAHGELDGFRPYYFTCAVLFLLSTVLCALIYNPPPRRLERDFSNAEKCAKLDWVGYSLNTVGQTFLVVGIFWKNSHSWRHPVVVSMLTCSLVFIVSLGFYGGRFKRDGILHRGLWTRNFTVATVCIFFEGFAFNSMWSFFPYELNSLENLSMTQYGFRFSQVTFVASISAFGVGMYMTVTKRVKAVTFLSFAVFFSFFLAMANAQQDRAVMSWYLPVVAGIALGSTSTCLLTAAQLSAPPDLISMATAVPIIVRLLGGDAASTIFTAMIEHVMGQFPDKLQVATTTAPLNMDPRFLKPLAWGVISENFTEVEALGIEEQYYAVGIKLWHDTQTAVFQNIWLVAGCFAGIGALVSLLISNMSDEFTETIDAPIEKDHGNDSHA